MAAVLACGPGALLSHRSAALLWGLVPSSPTRVDVTVPTRSPRSSQGVLVHRPRSLSERDRTAVRSIPCTSVARTLVDLAGVVNRRQLERACNQAEVLRLFDHRAVAEALNRGRGRRGAALLRRVLADSARAHTFTRSELEERFLALCRSAGLPQPRVNAWVELAPGDGLEVDFLWPAQRIIAETDGRAAHATRWAFENDRRRDQRLIAAGYTVVRFTWDQVTSRPQEVDATLAGLIRRR